MAVEKVAIRFDEDALTLGDLEDFEEIVGAPLHEALRPKTQRDEDGEIVRDEKGRPVQEVQMSTKALKALVFIVLRNERPDFTLDDARKIRVSALEMVESESEGNDSGQDAEAA